MSSATQQSTRCLGHHRTRLMVFLHLHMSSCWWYAKPSTAALAQNRHSRPCTRCSERGRRRQKHRTCCNPGNAIEIATSACCIRPGSAPRDVHSCNGQPPCHRCMPAAGTQPPATIASAQPPIQTAGHQVCDEPAAGTLLCKGHTRCVRCTHAGHRAFSTRESGPRLLLCKCSRHYLQCKRQSQHKHSSPGRSK